LQRCGPRLNLGITFHAPESAKECEGKNPHTPKWIPILRIRIPMDSRIFRRRLQGSKLIGLKSSLFNWKALGTWMFEMGLHDPFGYLKHKLWPKEGSRVKLTIIIIYNIIIIVNLNIICVHYWRIFMNQFFIWTSY
jgi:hypothetical protein